MLDIFKEVNSLIENDTQALSESVYQNNIVVRWTNGDLEGFAGTALSNAKKAKEIAQAKADRKAKMIKKEFTVLTDKDFAALDSAQKKRLKRDWDLSQRMDESKEMTEEQEDNKLKVTFHTPKYGPSGNVDWDKLIGHGVVTIQDWDRSKEDAAFKEAVRQDIIDKDAKMGSMDGSDEFVFFELKNSKRDTSEGYKLDGLFTVLTALSETKYKKWLENNADIEDQNESITDTVTNADPDEVDLKNKKYMSTNEKEIAKELAASLSVFLFGVENLLGEEFASAEEARQFIFSSFVALRTKNSGILMNMLKRFDRVGGERMADLFRKSLNKQINK
jgi:hypothetical protein